MDEHYGFADHTHKVVSIALTQAGKWGVDSRYALSSLTWATERGKASRSATLALRPCIAESASEPSLTTAPARSSTSCEGTILCGLRCRVPACSNALVFLLVQTLVENGKTG